MRSLELKGQPFETVLDEISRLVKPVGIIVVGLGTTLRGQVLAKINQTKLGTGAFIAFRNDDEISDQAKRSVAEAMTRKESVVAVAEGDAVLNTETQRRLIAWMHELGAANVIRIVVRCGNIENMTPHEVELNAWLWRWPSDPFGCDEERLIFVSDE